MQRPLTKLAQHCLDSLQDDGNLIMTYRERLMQISQEASSAKVQYSALTKEIDRIAATGQDVSQLQEQRAGVFKLYNDLLTEHASLLRSVSQQGFNTSAPMPGQTGD